jgi:hypothetical protein
MCVLSVMLGSLSRSFTSLSLLSNLICVLSVILGSLSCSFTSISLLSNLICVLNVMLGSLSCSFTCISLLSNLICVLSVMLGSLSCSFISISLLSNLICVLSVMLGSLSCSLYPRSPKGEGGILFYLCPSVLPSVRDVFRRTFLSNCWWQKSDIWSQASYRYIILWVAFLDPSDSYFLFADLVGFYTHWTYMHIFRDIFLSNYWWQKSDIWSQTSYRYPISW